MATLASILKNYDLSRQGGDVTYTLNGNKLNSVQNKTGYGISVNISGNVPDYASWIAEQNAIISKNNPYNAEEMYRRQGQDPYDAYIRNMISNSRRSSIQQKTSASPYFTEADITAAKEYYGTPPGGSLTPSQESNWALRNYNASTQGRGGNFFTKTFLSSPLGVAGLLALPLGAAAATGAFSAPVAAAPAGAAAPVGSVTATPLASSGSSLTNALLNAPSGLGAEAGFTASKVAQDSILSSILAGAAKGGITSAATGGNPLEGGVLGAITGGAGNILSDALPFLSSTGDSMFSWKDLLSLGATVGGTYLSTEAAKDAANAQIYGAQSAADINQSATDRAIQLGYDALNRIDQRWQEALSISQPYRNAGDVALANYESLLYGTPLNQTSTYLSAKERGDDMTAYGDVTQPFQFETTPGYQFRFDEGMKALENSAAARGGVLSGANMKAINEYGQNFATTEFDNVLSRLSGLVSQGALSSGQATTGSQNVGTQESNVLSGIGNTITQGGDTAAQLATQIGAAQASGYLNQQNLPNTVANLGAQYIGKNWFGA